MQSQRWRGSKIKMRRTASDETRSVWARRRAEGIALFPYMSMVLCSLVQSEERREPFPTRWRRSSNFLADARKRG